MSEYFAEIDPQPEFACDIEPAAEFEATLVGVFGGGGGGFAKRQWSIHWPVATNVGRCLVAYAAFPFTIDSIRSLATSQGSIVASVKVNGVDVAGLAAATIDGTPGSHDATGSNVVNVGDRVDIIFSSNANARDVFLTIGYTQTGDE